jgi:hypothetical protein
MALAKATQVLGAGVQYYVPETMKNTYMEGLNSQQITVWKLVLLSMHCVP